MVKILRKKRKGNVSIILLAIFIVFTLAINSMLILERKTISIKRQNIHNAVIAANLSSYYAIEQGQKDIVLGYRPDKLSNYLKNPTTIAKDGVIINNVVNIMTSEYFPKGQRYKSIFINEELAYSYFNTYIEKNLNLVKSNTNSYLFVPSQNSNNKGDIKELKVKSFEVFNAIYKDMTGYKFPTNIAKESRVYSGIHLDLDVTVNHDIKYGTIKDTANIPIHIDTEITLFRPTIK